MSANKKSPSSVRGSKRVINALNEARSRELTAIATYMAQHYELEDQDYGKVADLLKKIAIREMKHAEMLAERILFLGGEPTSKPDGTVVRGQCIEGMTDTDIQLEEQAVAMYNDSTLLCSEEKDNVSKEVFEELLKDEEDHLNTFENIRDHIKKLGDIYLATLTGGGEG